MKPLFKTAIYVNRAVASLEEANHGKEASDWLTEHKAWTSGKKFFDEAHESGYDLALIFAQYRELGYWAIAEEIKVDPAKKTTDYHFSNLQEIHGRQRNDLTVLSTGEPLPNNFIRSYALVKTPDFLRR